MTAAEQFKRWGACVDSHGGDVILQVGKELVSLSPREAQRFAFYLARAYADSSYIARRRNQVVIGGPR